MSLCFPSQFVLASAMNPCPCGFYSHPQKECRCTPLKIRNYLGRISGPLLDRLGIHIKVSSIPYHELTCELTAEPSSVLRDRVNKARKRQLKRYGKSSKKEKSKVRQIFSNAQLGPKQIKKFCSLDKESKDLLHTTISRLGLSARAYDRIIKVVRTIADRADSEDIRPEHIFGAIQYRNLDRDFWGDSFSQDKCPGNSKLPTIELTLQQRCCH